MSSATRRAASARAAATPFFLPAFMQLLKSLAKSSKTSGFRLRISGFRLRISGFRLRIGGDSLRNRGECLRIIETEIQFTTEAQRTQRRDLQRRQQTANFPTGVNGGRRQPISQLPEIGVSPSLALWKCGSNDKQNLHTMYYAFLPYHLRGAHVERSCKSLSLKEKNYFIFLKISCAGAPHT